MADNIIGFNPTKTEEPKQKTFTYKFELKNPDSSEQAHGLLSYGHAFVGVVKDETTPLLLIPYERVVSITADA